jgi:hypothetical protein
VRLPGSGAAAAYRAEVRRFIPSPALVVASLALALSLGGVSYAATKIGTKDIANDAIISVKVKDGSLRPADLSPAVAKSLQVRAYARVVVSQGVAFDANRTKGFGSVTRPKNGVYCLDLTDTSIDASRTAPVVTVDWDDSTGNNLSAFVSGSAHDCPTGTDLGVRTYSFKAGKANSLSNVVAFTVLVP